MDFTVLSAAAGKVVMGLRPRPAREVLGAGTLLLAELEKSRDAITAMSCPPP
jgi:hypothetical protein